MHGTVRLLATGTAVLAGLALLAGCDRLPGGGGRPRVSGYTPPPRSAPPPAVTPEPFCPETVVADWRKAQTIDGVDIAADPVCMPDNPWQVAAVVKGTNNVSMATMMRTNLAMDAVTKGRDLDGDGDPDEIHIRLEVSELNGHSPDMPDVFPQYAIAPGVMPGFWVFTPKARGMVTENFESLKANPLIRMPAPTIRVEQGDHVLITLENTHYFPHTIHLHGVDHPWERPDGQGNDGVPQTTDMMAMPGRSWTYEIRPRQPGSMMYHCHVQTGAHILMGLAGLFVIEENRPNNWVQTFNVGAGKVRHPSVAVRERYAQEYDLHYIGADPALHNIIQRYNDPRLIARDMNRRYALPDRADRYHLLNGRSFPYTLRESLIVVRPEQRVKLRILNADGEMLALHFHGHKPTVTHLDGIALKTPALITRDVFDIAPAQRNDIEIWAHDDGLHSYGPGVWIFHDHREQGITTNGMMPGGDVSAVVYEAYLGDNGVPKVKGASLAPYFTKEYWERRLPVWMASDPMGRLGEPARR